MRKAFVFSLAALIMCAAAVFTACGSGGDGPGSHTLSLGGASHLEGHTNPLVFCTACHGADLRGGEGPSCYSCHNSSGHAAARGGRRHRAGAEGSCSVCHGPDNSGGIGPACTACH
jgi:hypothetical protein